MTDHAIEPTAKGHISRAGNYAAGIKARPQAQGKTFAQSFTGNAA